MTQTTDQELAEFEAWALANNKYHVSGYNPHNDLWEAWQAASRAQVVPQDGLHRIRLLLRVAKNQVNKAAMAHAISVVQDELDKVALAAAPQCSIK